MKLTSKKVRDYMSYRTPDPLIHCPDCIAAACNDMVIKFNNEFSERLNAKDLMKLIFFNDPIVSLHTHNYGFHTATGRHIINTIKDYYYEFNN